MNRTDMFVNKHKQTLCVIRIVLISVFFASAMGSIHMAGKSAAEMNAAYILFFLFASALLRSEEKLSPDRHIRLCSGVFAALYSAALLAGEAVNRDNSTASLFSSPLRGLLSVLYFTCLFLVCRSAAALILQWLSGWAGRGNVSDGKGFTKAFFLRWAVTFFFWMPAMLAYYPGIMAYDTRYQTYMASTGLANYTKLHPPLHTWIWGLFLKLREATGIEASTSYGIVQALLLSAILAWAVGEVFGARRRADALVTLFFACNPVFAVMAINPTKDVCFAMAFTAFFVLLRRLVLNGWRFRGKKDGFLFSLSILLSCLFRNNAPYVFLVFLVFCLIIRKVQSVRPGVLAAILLPLILFYGINDGLYPAIGIAEGNTREMLSVPMMQIARVSLEEREHLTEEECEQIDTYLDPEVLPSRYNPRFADGTKFLFSEEAFQASGKQFVKLWLSLMVKYPGDYLDAWLSLHLPYWYPNAAPVDPVANRRYVETVVMNNDYCSFIRPEKFPRLLQFYEKAASCELFRDVPVAAGLFSLQAPLWLLAFCICAAAARRRYVLIMLYMPSLLLWLTYILGPVSNFRYVFPLFLLFPFYLEAVSH